MDFFGFEFDDVKPKPNVDDFGFRLDADKYNNETEKFQQEIKTLKPAFDELVAIGSIDNLDFNLDPLDSLISRKGFDAEEDDIAVKSLDELLDEMLTTDNDDVYEDVKEEEEDETASLDTFETASLSRSESQMVTPVRAIKKRNNQQIKENAVFQPLEHLYSHK
jgi:hypothetical protein